MKPMNGLLPLPAFHILALLTLLFQTLSPSLFPFPGALPAPEQSYPIQQSRPLHRARLLAEVAEPSPAPASAAAPAEAAPAAAAPYLTLTAAPLTLPAAGNDKALLSVTIHNSGAEVARRVRLFIEGSDYVAAGSIFVGDIAAGETRAVRLPLQLTGRRYTAPVHLLLTAAADNQTARPQTVTTLTFLPPGPQSLNALSYLSAPDGINADVRVEPLAARAAPHGAPVAADDPAFWLRFRLHNWPAIETGAASLLEWHLAEYAGEFPLDQTALQLTYQSAANNFVAVPIPFTYHEQRHTLSFAPRGDGTYTMGILSEPEPPSSWTPTYREPVVSLFQGSVSYQYLFLTPPGPNGFAPNLALVYGSGAGNGQTGKAQSDPAGFGWQLSGLVEIAQGLRLCGLGDSVCPALTYQDAEGVHTGELQFTLSLDGAGYALVHKDGAASNGNPGRYHARGLASLYVEMCDHDNATPSLVCSSEAGGNASEQVSRRYWVVKTGDNTTYRLGYTGNSEQEVVGMIPAADVENPAYLLPALRWQADYGHDRFDNFITYTYLEDPAPINQTDPADNYAFSPASYIDHIDYGLTTITFVYGATGALYNPDLNSRSLSWQTQHLTGINIEYDGQPVRSYALEKTAALHGHNNDNQYPNQTDWCTTDWEATSLTGWKHVMLTAITEYDAAGYPRVADKPDVTFDYVMRRTGQTFYDPPDGYFKFCYPYLDKVETLYHPAVQPTAQFTYNPDDDAHHLPYYANDGGPSDTNTHLSTVISQRLDSGWAADAPPQRTDFVYAQPDYGGRYVSSSGNSSNHYPLIFQGFHTATRLLFANETDTTPQLREINHFLAYNYNEDTGNENPALNGRLQAQEIQDSDQRLRRQTGNEWTLLDTGGSPQRQAVLMQTITIDILNGAVNRTEYVYDAYGHQREMREFGADLTGAVPVRTQETLYLANASAAAGGDTWLVNLPWRITTWNGLPGADVMIVSRMRLRYDDAGCETPATPPTIGLLTNQDSYLPDAGTPPCDDWLVTNNYYGGAGGGQGAWWQLTRVVDPSGRWQQTYWDSADPTRISQSENSIGATTYAYTDANTPWLLTGSKQPNGGAAAYAYDTFGRLLELYAPDGATGDPTLTTEYEYYDAGIDGVLPLAIAEITYLNDSGTQTAVTRTFYDALGRPLQQRSWGSSSDFGITLVDYEYNGRGQLTCQTAPVSGGAYTFNSALDCLAYDHTETQYNLFGQPTAVTTLDSVTAWQQALGQTQLTLNSLGQLHAAQQDTLGRWGTVEELNPTYDGFPTESGPFDLDTGHWSYANQNATVNPAFNLNGETVLKLKSNEVGGSGWHKLLWGSSYNLQPGNGVLLRFQLEQTNYEGRLSLSTSDLLNAVFVGLVFHGNQIYPDYNLGSGDQNFPGVALPQQAGVWYWLQMNVAADGVVSWRV